MEVWGGKSAQKIRRAHSPTTFQLDLVESEKAVTCGDEDL
jgi:hypothetical protein